MASKLNRAAYEQMVKEDLDWLDQQPDTLEREHIRHIVSDSIRVYYDLTPEQLAAEKATGS